MYHWQSRIVDIPLSIASRQMVFFLDDDRIATVDNQKKEKTKKQKEFHQTN